MKCSDLLVSDFSVIRVQCLSFSVMAMSPLLNTTASYIKSIIFDPLRHHQIDMFSVLVLIQIWHGPQRAEEIKGGFCQKGSPRCKILNFSTEMRVKLAISSSQFSGKFG